MKPEHATADDYRKMPLPSSRYFKCSVNEPGYLFLLGAPAESKQEMRVFSCYEYRS